MAKGVIWIDVNSDGELCQLCKKGRVNELSKVISGDPEGKHFDYMKVCPECGGTWK